ncbi:PAS domain-containing hybrid sensor histidine kinase/response regulator [Piscinibacter sp.]|uniref:PAS domain-containing hybrid sensor histidine kinase/response regulator n=1 Tax=Piscinibacter sp. TaxID=1903157 RepID=UPI001DA6B22E|nr:PAS domain-containing hybrid sensor histidine kinase/response regulator [Piscinibacter sp.]MBK7531775.1 PAS domain S-box protein [Piscinibacter sp.]HPG80905.1 PAS domain S-box protein [Piscinibacter sp.]
MNSALSEVLVAQSPDALIATHPDGRVALWNRAAEATFGYSAEEALGLAMAQLIVPRELHDDEIQLRKEALDGLGVRHEVLRQRKDGVPLYVNCSMGAVRDAQGEVTHLVSHLADVTRQRAWRDSAFVHARFHAVLDNAPDAIVIVNGAGRIVLFNAQARRLFGHESAAVIGEPIELLLPQRLQRAHLSQRLGFLGAPRMRAMGEGRELHGVRASGEEFPVEISLSPIDTEAGRLVMSAIRDISERKRFELALREKNDELERASRAKDRFLATMSHELRTPLNAIIGFTGLMLMKLPGPLTPDQEKQLGLVQSSGKHLLSLINDLLDLAKIESGRVELRLDAVDCATVLDEVLQTLRPAAQARGLWLRLDPRPGWPAVRADRRALLQILINLTGNAVKFTQAGGVTLAVRDVDDGVRIEVRDTGPGLSASDRARLFEPFTQVGDARTRNAEGTGLGLHLSTKLAALMGGRIDVSSEFGQGSCFTLNLARG